MNLKKIRLATSQFPMSSTIEDNKTHIPTQMEEAKAADCDLIHFPESSLSGYPGVDFRSFENFDWKKVRQYTEEIIHQAKALKLWVILDSSHPLYGDTKPHNSLYIIDNTGQIIDRYDKLFCAENPDETIEDLVHYSPGDHFTTFKVNGIKCGCLICHNYRYPELYRELKKRDVDIVVHYFHAGNMDTERQEMMEEQVGVDFHALNPDKTIPEITMPASMIAYASSNYVWISCSNTSAKESCWGSFTVRPESVIAGQLRKNKTGILITAIDVNVDYYDSSKHWRERSMNCFFTAVNWSMIRDQKHETGYEESRQSQLQSAYCD